MYIVRYSSTNNTRTLEDYAADSHSFYQRRLWTWHQCITVSFYFWISGNIYTRVFIFIVPNHELNPQIQNPYLAWHTSIFWGRVGVVSWWGGRNSYFVFGAENFENDWHSPISVWCRCNTHGHDIQTPPSNQRIWIIARSHPPRDTLLQ